MKSPEQRILERGANHQGGLQKSAETLSSGLDESELFSPEAEEELERFFEEHTEDIPDYLESIFSVYKASEGSKAPGHDKSHILDNLERALCAFRAQQLSVAQKFEIILSCIAHDLGRVAEPHLREIPKKDIAVLMPAVVGRKLMTELDLPEVLGKRVLYNIHTGFTPTTGHITADLVHRFDRELLMGGLRIARDLAFALGEGGLSFKWPANSDLEQYRTDVPDPYAVKNFHAIFRAIMVGLDFIVRNLHPLAGPDGESVSAERRQEMLTILMISLTENQEGFEHVFAPELKIVPPESLSSRKKQIPEEIFEAAQAETAEFMKTFQYREGQEYTLACQLMEVEGIPIPDEFEERFEHEIAQYTPQERYNFSALLTYSLERQHERRLQSLRELESMPKDEIDTIVSEWVVEELKEREKRYSDIRKTS